MPLEFLTDAQVAGYGRFEGVPSRADLERLALHNLRLESHTDTPDFVAIARLLRDRYGYGTDDVAHADLLAGDDASS